MPLINPSASHLGHAAVHVKVLLELAPPGTPPEPGSNLWWGLMGGGAPPSVPNDSDGDTAWRLCSELIGDSNSKSSSSAKEGDEEEEATWQHGETFDMLRRAAGGGGIARCPMVNDVPMADSVPSASTAAAGTGSPLLLMASTAATNSAALPDPSAPLPVRGTADTGLPPAQVRESTVVLLLFPFFLFVKKHMPTPLSLTPSTAQPAIITIEALHLHASTLQACLPTPPPPRGVQVSVFAPPLQAHAVASTAVQRVPTRGGSAQGRVRVDQQHWVDLGARGVLECQVWVCALEVTRVARQHVGTARLAWGDGIPQAVGAHHIRDHGCGVLQCLSLYSMPVVVLLLSFYVDSEPSTIVRALLHQYTSSWLKVTTSIFPPCFACILSFSYVFNGVCNTLSCTQGAAVWDALCSSASPECSGPKPALPPGVPLGQPPPPHPCPPKGGVSPSAVGTVFAAARRRRSAPHGARQRA